MTMTFEISNPSDYYTLESDDWPAACVACLIIGKGNYGLHEIDGEHDMPIFLLGGYEEWVEEEFDLPQEEFIGSVDKIAVAACLNSIVIGNRADYIQGLGDKTGEEADAFWNEWHDRNRSSMSDIGSYARNYAAKMIEQFGDDNADS